MTERQIDEDIKLINQFLKERGESILINKKTQDSTTIISLLGKATGLIRKTLIRGVSRPDIDRRMILSEAIERTCEHFSNPDARPVVFSQSANATLRELSKQSPNQNHEISITHSQEIPPSPKRH
jgi:hypothetical protein